MRSRVPSLQRNIGLGGAATFLALLVIGYFVYTVSGFGTFADFIGLHLAIELLALSLLFTLTAVIPSSVARVLQVAVLLVFGLYTLVMADLGSIAGIPIGGVGAILAAHYGYFQRRAKLKGALLMSLAFVAIALQIYRFRGELVIGQSLLGFAYSATAVLGLAFAYVLVLRDAARDAANRQSLLEQAVAERTESLRFEIDSRKIAEENERLAAAEAKRLAAERLELLREVHHRANNSLQMAISLVESMNPGSRDDQSITVNRIRAIGLVYDIIDSARDLNSIELEEYLESLYSYLQMSRPEAPVMVLYDPAGSHRARLEAPISLGLMMNEIFQLACEYSFPRRPGAIEVRQSETDSHYTFEVVHSGERLPK
ncbi:MAG: histidine kinase dimerization/phosphoacceptor domain -containing protein, partial [Spirochaetota bacterium]